MYYDLYGNESNAYDINGNPIDNDVNINADIVPILLITDTHTKLNNTTKPFFDSLANRTNWNNVSAFINLGDDGNEVNESSQSNMANCLSYIPSKKKILLMGNHDVWRNGSNGTRICTNEEFEDYRNKYYDNSCYGSQCDYKGLGIETMVDSVRNIRYVVASGWDDSKADGTNYKWNVTTKMMDDIISMLSIVDNNDIVWLSHIIPCVGTFTRYFPNVDGNEATTDTWTPMRLDTMDYRVAFNTLLSDRKHKRSGSITDSDGVVHTYDFTNCTSDLLLCLHGHMHRDFYLYNGDVPYVLLDAYAYDNHPYYRLEIDKANNVLNVTKIDDVTSYEYQVGLTHEEKMPIEITVENNVIKVSNFEATSFVQDGSALIVGGE